MQLLNADEAIESLQELGFCVNELKKQGQKVMPIKSYEMLLEWAIESVVTMRDYYEKEIHSLN